MRHSVTFDPETDALKPEPALTIPERPIALTQEAPPGAQPLVPVAARQRPVNRPLGRSAR